MNTKLQTELDTVGIPEQVNELVESITKREAEQRERLDESIRVSSILASRTGRELSISAIDNVDSIGNSPGAYMLTSHPELVIKRTDFEVKRELLSGTRDSAHAVVSGVLEVVRDGFDRPQHIDVAVKCFSGKREPADRVRRARQEILVSQMMIDRGRLGFKPRSMIVGMENGPTEGSVAVLTEYDRSILSLDNHTWANGSRQTMELAFEAARALGETNSMGIVHKDAKIKNVAQDDQGRFGMIDFETSELFDPTNPTKAGSAMVTDLSLLIDSLKKRSFFESQAIDDNRIIDDMMLAYFAGWGNELSPEINESLLSNAISVHMAIGHGVDDIPATPAYAVNSY